METKKILSLLNEQYKSLHKTFVSLEEAYVYHIGPYSGLSLLRESIYYISTLAVIISHSPWYFNIFHSSQLVELV